MATNTPKKGKNRDLGADQANLSFQVAKRTHGTLTSQDWDEIATEMGISNGRAAKERFRYLMVQFKGAESGADGGMDGGTNGSTGEAKKPNAVKTAKTPRKRAIVSAAKNGASAKKKARTEAKSEDGDKEDGSGVQNGQDVREENESTSGAEE